MGIFFSKPFGKLVDEYDLGSVGKAKNEPLIQSRVIEDSNEIYNSRQKKNQTNTAGHELIAEVKQRGVPMFFCNFHLGIGSGERAADQN